MPLSQPTLIGPLYHNAANITVKNITPGSVLQVFAKSATGENPLSEQVTIHSIQAVIDLATVLKEGGEIYVAQSNASGDRVDSTVEPVVVFIPTLLPPNMLANAVAGDTEVHCWGVIPGAVARIYVSRNNQARVLAGSMPGNNLFRAIQIPCLFPLEAGDIITIQQQLGGQISEFGSTVSVLEKNSFGPRPFYVIGHNPNSIDHIKEALEAGANAIEPDVNVYESNQGDLCISETGKLNLKKGGFVSSPALEPFLDELHEVALQYPQLSLVVFDCKPKTGNPDLGLKLLTEIRNRLTYDTGLNIIISVSDFDYVAIFDSIKYILGPREGMMIDYENDPVAVSAYFESIGVANQCFANGVTITPLLFPSVQPSMERVNAFRASTNKIKFIYVWTINHDHLMREYLDIGVDGINTDHVDKLKDIVTDISYQKSVRMASRLDDPMKPANTAYSLSVHTGDARWSGTGANITFTLTGTQGSSSIAISASAPYRMERNDWNYITLHSPDLGPLISVSVQLEDQGIAPDWFLDVIKVESFRYNVSKTATFNKWINSTSTFVENLI